MINLNYLPCDNNLQLPTQQNSYNIIVISNVIRKCITTAIKQNTTFSDEAETLKGRHLTQETRQKISEAKKGRHLTQETRQKMSEVRKGRHHTQETRQKMSEVRKGRHHTQETRQKISEAKKGRHHTQETRQKISEAKKGRHLTQETRQKMSEVKKGRHLTQETRQKISEAKKGRHHIQETRQKISAVKRRFQNPEIVQLTQQRADEAINSRLAKIQPQIKVERQEELLPTGNDELQITGFSRRIVHRIDNSLPILQDINSPPHSLFSEAEGSIDQIKISGYGDLELSSIQKKQMLEEVKEWINVNENNREIYQQKFDELFEISIPIEIGPDRGLSVYAKRNIRKFEVVGPYAGILQRSEEELNRSIRKKGSYNVLSYLFSTRSKNRTIDAFGSGNTLSLINTGQLCGRPIWNDNNLSIIQIGKNLNFYAAKRDIFQGEELLIDYGPNYNPMYILKVETED